MKTEEIENCCICEIELMLEGWQQRYIDQMRLLAQYCALPVYQMQMGKKAPKLEDIVPREKAKGSKLSASEFEELKRLTLDTD